VAFTVEVALVGVVHVRPARGHGAGLAEPVLLAIYGDPID
jgi:hypothetical protein